MSSLKKLAFTSLVTFISIGSAYAQMEYSLYTRTCEGNVRVNGYEEHATIHFMGPTLALYTGPHASLSLPKEDLEIGFSVGGSEWYRANLSSGSGHGAETNIFFYRDVVDGSIDFMYRGTLGYLVEGNLECTEPGPNI